MLEDAVHAVQEARGASGPVHDDKHSADPSAPRQAAAIAGGATFDRIEGEIEHARRTGKMPDGERATPAILAAMETHAAILRLQKAIALADVVSSD